MRKVLLTLTLLLGVALVASGQGQITRALTTVGGNLFFATDNTQSIGAAAGNRPQFVYVGTSVVLGANGTVQWTGRSGANSLADGEFEVSNNAGTLGIRLQFGTAPTIASGFGTSPAITTGSLDSSGDINVGTGGTATTGVINFGTTWATAPRCIVADSTNNTATRASVISTTQLTILAAAAWAASDHIQWLCIGSK